MFNPVKYKVKITLHRVWTRNFNNTKKLKYIIFGLLTIEFLSFLK